MTDTPETTTYTLTGLTTQQMLCIGVLLLELGYEIVPIPYRSISSPHEDLIGPTTLVYSASTTVTLHKVNERTPGDIRVEGKQVSEVVRMIRQWLAEMRDTTQLQERCIGGE